MDIPASDLSLLVELQVTQAVPDFKIQRRVAHDLYDNRERETTSSTDHGGG